MNLGMRYNRCQSAARTLSDQEKTHLKKATRDNERSSSTLRDEANIARSTAGVTGMRLGSVGDGGCGAPEGMLAPPTRLLAYTLAVFDGVTVDEVVVPVLLEGIMISSMCTVRTWRR